MSPLTARNLMMRLTLTLDTLEDDAAADDEYADDDDLGAVCPH